MKVLLHIQDGMMTGEKGSWGGARPGAGNPEFKPKWKSGKTTVIRVPEAIADEVLAVARQIDEGEAVTLSTVKSEVVDSAAQPEKEAQLKELCQKLGELEVSLFKAHRELEQVTQERDEYFEQIGEVRLELDNLKSEVVTQSSEAGTDASILFNQLRPLLNRLSDRERRAIQQKLKEILD